MQRSARELRERSPKARDEDEPLAPEKKQHSGLEKKASLAFLALYIALVAGVLALDSHDWGAAGFWTRARVGDWGAADPGHWCEHERPQKFMREKWNAFSDLSFLGVSLWMLRCAIVDHNYSLDEQRGALVDITTERGKETWRRDDALSLRNHPWRSVLFAGLNAFHFFGTFTNHASRLQFGHICDVAGMFGILGVLSLHGICLRWECLHGKKMSNALFTAVMAGFMSLAYRVARDLLYNHWATEPIELGGFVVSLLPMLVSGASLCRSAGCAARGFGRRLAVEGDRHWAQLKLSVAMLAVGAISQTVDQPRHAEVPLWKWAVGKHQEVFGECFSADSVSPMHAVWHVTTAVAMLLIYQTFRWLHVLKSEKVEALFSSGKA